MTKCVQPQQLLLVFRWQLDRVTGVENLKNEDQTKGKKNGVKKIT